MFFILFFCCVIYRLYFLAEVLHMVFKQNYFEFEGTYFTLKKGLAMGNPISVIISKIFLDHIENKCIIKQKTR